MGHRRGAISGGIGGGGAGVTVHGALLGLADDDHLQYFLSLGRAGGQTLVGGTASGEDLILQSTSDATRGVVRSLDRFEAKAGILLDGPTTIDTTIVFDRPDLTTAQGIDWKEGGLQVISIQQGVGTRDLVVQNSNTTASLIFKMFGSVITESRTNTNVTAITRGNVSQTLDLHQYQDSAQVVLASIDKDGNATFPTLTVNSDAVISGNLTVSGSAFEQFSGEVNVADNHFFMNAGYTAVVAQTGGMVVNYLPTATTDTVAATGFVAGVASTSNPTVITTGSATFAVGDFIQISDANDVANNGIREVLSHVGNTLTIRGVGTTGTVEDFTGTDFATDTTVAGAITKVNVSVSRAGTDGLWETANGSSTGLVFSDFLLTTAIGVTVAASGDVTASSLTMVTGKLLGRSTAATGAVEELTVGSGLDLSGGTLTAPGGETILRGRKTADQTFTSDTTLADLTGLSVSLLANKNYRVIVRIPAITGAGGLQTALNGPAGSTNLRITTVIMTSSGAGAAGNKSAYDDSVGSGSSSTTEHVISALIENGGTAGALTARGAQNTSNGAGSTVQRGATIEAIEVA